MNTVGRSQQVRQQQHHTDQLTANVSRIAASNSHALPTEGQHGATLAERRSPRPTWPTLSLPPLWFLGIHHHEDDAAWLLAVVEPSMIGRLLHDDVSGFEVDGFVVEHHVDLA